MIAKYRGLAIVIALFLLGFTMFIDGLLGLGVEVWRRDGHAMTVFDNAIVIGYAFAIYALIITDFIILRAFGLVVVDLVRSRSC